MKYFILLIIRIYWKVIPPDKRKKCIFRESCSNYVSRITEEQGFVAGVKAFMFRNKHCRPGYAIYRYKGRYNLKTAGGLLLEEEEIDERLLTPDNPYLIDFDNPDLATSGKIKLK